VATAEPDQTGLQSIEPGGRGHARQGCLFALRHGCALDYPGPPDARPSGNGRRTSGPGVPAKMMSCCTPRCRPQSSGARRSKVRPAAKKVVLLCPAAWVIQVASPSAYPEVTAVGPGIVQLVIRDVRPDPVALVSAVGVSFMPRVRSGRSKRGTALMMIKITPWQHQSPGRDLKGRHGTSQRARHPSSTP
jgi:hypothetical protein